MHFCRKSKSIIDKNRNGNVETKLNSLQKHTIHVYQSNKLRDDEIIDINQKCRDNELIRIVFLM